LFISCKNSPSYKYSAVYKVQTAQESEFFFLPKTKFNFIHQNHAQRYVMFNRENFVVPVLDYPLSAFYQNELNIYHWTGKIHLLYQQHKLSTEYRWFSNASVCCFTPIIRSYFFPSRVFRTVWKFSLIWTNCPSGAREFHYSSTSINENNNILENTLSCRVFLYAEWNCAGSG
jgi:hypothetical protein